MKGSAFNYLIILLVAAQLINLSCSSDDNSIEVAGDSFERTIDPKLVGTWRGTVEESSGTANATFTLQMNGDILAETDSQVLCPFQGVWWVANGQLTASGEDECDGRGVDIRGNTTSSTRISGSWTAGSENSGTFSLTKQ